MEQNKLTFYDDWYVFEDMLLCAFRYAIGRHTYIVGEACDFFKNNSHLISKRMFIIMMKDLDEQIETYEKCVDTKYGSCFVRTDLDMLLLFKNFLIDYGKRLDTDCDENF